MVLRRELLGKSAGITALVSLSGCLGGDDSSGSDGTTLRDSDGDGVPDKHDYAPRDADVQSEEDIKDARTTTAPTPPTETPTRTQTSTAIDIPTPTETPTETRAPTATSTPGSGVSGWITADTSQTRDLVSGTFLSYSASAAELLLRPTELDGVSSARLKALVVLGEYRTGDVIDYDASEAFQVSSDVVTPDISYSLSFPENREGVYLSLLVFPAHLGAETALDSGEVEHVADTDRLSVTENRLQKDPYPKAKDDLDTGDYQRITGEGVYLVEMRGEVTFSLVVFKRAYAQANERPTIPTRRVIEQAQRDGVADEYARLLHDSAVEAGRSGERQKANYVLQAVQALPYTADSDDDYDDYSKYPIETLVEAGGDCEDTVILTASAWMSQPFNYGCVLLFLPPENPRHIAVGVRGSADIDGSYYTYRGERYFYVETTGEGWDIGEIPDEYREMRAQIEPITNY